MKRGEYCGSVAVYRTKPGRKIAASVFVSASTSVGTTASTCSEIRNIMSFLRGTESIFGGNLWLNNFERQERGKGERPSYWFQLGMVKQGGERYTANNSIEKTKQFYTHLKYPMQSLCLKITMSVALHQLCKPKERKRGWNAMGGLYIIYCEPEIT